MFQNSEILLSEKKCWTKVVIVPDFNILLPITHDIQIFFILVHFEMTSPQHLAKISRYWENSFVNAFITSKFLLQFQETEKRISGVSFTVASFGHFSSQFWIDDVTNLCQNFKILTKWFQKRVMNLKVSFSFPYHISINIGKWNLNLDLFDPFLGW